MWRLAGRDRELALVDALARQYEEVDRLGLGRRHTQVASGHSVLLIEEDHTWLMPGNLGLLIMGVADQNQTIADLAQARCCAVQMYGARVGLARKHISLKSRSVVQVHDLNPLVRYQVRRLDEREIERERSLVVHIRFSYRSAVNLGFAEFSSHLFSMVST